MTKMRIGIIVGLFCGLAPDCPAQEPAKDAPPAKAKDELPPPRVVEEIIISDLPYRPEHGKRDVWQYYGVTSSGRFVPRVVLSPAGSYYLHNFMHYPWPSTRTTIFMPYAQD